MATKDELFDEISVLNDVKIPNNELTAKMKPKPSG